MRSLGWLIFSWLLSASLVVAQSNSCPAIVEQALQAVGDNCDQLSRNSACYGFNRVDSTFFAEQESGFFSQPSDRALLGQLLSLKTAPLNTSNGEWGVAVMNVLANVPNSLPGQGVMFLLMGDVEVTNDVNPEAAFTPAAAVEAVVAQTTALLGNPTRASNTLATLAIGTPIAADALSVDGAFVRAVVGNSAGWVALEALENPDTLADLPIVASAQRTPMQAFYFSTGIGQPECNEAQATLAIQSPENIKVDLTVNGVDIRVGSMLTFTQGPNGPQMTVHRGGVQLPNGQTLGAGNTSLITFDFEGNIVGFGDAIPADEGVIEQGLIVQNFFNQISNANDWPLFEAFGSPNFVDETPPSLPPNPTDCPFPNPAIYTVQRGDTLFSIARAYDANLPAIVAANNIPPSATIFVGQQLTIPNPCSGFVNLPSSAGPVAEQPADEDNPQGADCAGFGLVSPLGTSAPSGDILFDWNPAPGATLYQLNIYGSRNSSFRTTETQYSANSGELGAGGSFQWEVIAFAGDAILCSSGRSPQLIQEGAPPPEPPPYVVRWTCGATTGEVDVSWSGFDIGEVLTIDFSTTVPNNTYNATVSGPSGMYTFFGIFGTLGDIRIIGEKGGVAREKGGFGC